MGAGRGERNYVLVTRNIFQLKSAKQEREAKFGTRERESWYAKKSFEKARRNAEREEEMKECGHASRKGPAGTHPALVVWPAAMATQETGPAGDWSTTTAAGRLQ